MLTITGILLFLAGYKLHPAQAALYVRMGQIARSMMLAGALLTVAGLVLQWFAK